MYVLHAEQLSSEEDAIAARKRLVQAVFSWQESSQAANAASVNVICDIIQGSSSEWGCRPGAAQAGCDLKGQPTTPGSCTGSFSFANRHAWVKEGRWGGGLQLRSGGRGHPLDCTPLALPHLPCPAVPDESMADPDGESAAGAQLCRMAGGCGLPGTGTSVALGSVGAGWQARKQGDRLAGQGNAAAAFNLLAFSVCIVSSLS